MPEMKIVIAIIILLVLAVAAIAGQGWFRIGKDPLAAENLPNSPTGITVDTLAKMRFSTEINGYSQAEVDAFLELLRQRLLAEQKAREGFDLMLGHPEYPVN